MERRYLFIRPRPKDWPAVRYLLSTIDGSGSVRVSHEQDCEGEGEGEVRE